MSSELLHTLGIVAFSIAVAAVILAVVLWVVLDIKNVIGFLSGKNAEKAIQALREGKKGAAYSMAKKPGEAPSPRYAGNSLSDEVVDKTMLINNQKSEFGGETVALDDETYALDNEPYIANAKACAQSNDTYDINDETCAIDNVGVPDDYDTGTILVDTPEKSADSANVFTNEETVILTTELNEIEFDI